MFIQGDAKSLVCSTLWFRVTIMITFEGNDKMGVIGKRFIIVINDVKTIQIYIFASVVENNELCLANVNHHLVHPKPDCNLF